MPLGIIPFPAPFITPLRDYTPMTKGKIGIVACPMLEDELVRSLRDDEEDKRVVLLRTGAEGPIRSKMAEEGIAFEEFDEFDFMNGWIDFDDDRFNIIITMNNMALHAEPKKLMDYIQDQLIMLQGRVDAVGLYYGMCGNYGWDITKWAEERGLDFKVAVFRDCKGRVIDDCIGVSVGGLDGYQRLLKNYTGHLLLTPCFANNWIEFLMAGEVGKSAKFIKSSGDPQADMKRLLLFCGYTSAVQIDTGLEPKERFDAKAKEITDYMGFELKHAPPDFVDLGPMHRMYAECKQLLAEKEARRSHRVRGVRRLVDGLAAHDALAGVLLGPVGAAEYLEPGRLLEPVAALVAAAPADPQDHVVREALYRVHVADALALVLVGPLVEVLGYRVEQHAHSRDD